jgi:hypothetical protein
MRFLNIVSGLVVGGSIGLGLVGQSTPAAIAQIATTSLYNPARQQLPAAQGWLRSIPTGATQQLTATGATDLNTNGSLGFQAGYMRFSPWNLMRLNRATGYTLRFDVQLLAETHSSPHRAGLSVIAVSSDLRAIELGFWRDRIWVQNDARNGIQFTQGEGVNWPTGTAVQRYNLVVQGDNYCLFHNTTLTQPILRGKLRNYSSFGFPYSTGSLIFVGDNTQSASAISRIERVDYQDRPIAPCL